MDSRIGFERVRVERAQRERSASVGAASRYAPVAPGHDGLRGGPRAMLASGLARVALRRRRQAARAETGC
jgi:hypothetical protein